MNMKQNQNIKANKILFGQTFFLSLVSLLCLLTIFSAPFSFAEGDSNNNKAALAKAQYMLRQAANEKSELEKQVVSQKQAIDGLEKQIAQLKKEATGKQSESSAQVNAISQLKESGQKLQQRISSDSAKYDQLVSTKEKLEESLDKQTQNFGQCYDNNKKLYQINQEILGKYKDKGFWSVFAQKEPVTSLGAVKVENLIQDYQYQMDGLTVKLVSEDKSKSTNTSGVQ